jgi:hypothetical protein
MHIRTIAPFILTLFIFVANAQTSVRKTEFPYLGEKLEYKLSYGGWFTLGKATATIDPNFSTKNNVKYFKTRLNAKTVWFLSFIKNIDDVYISHLRAADMKPLYSEVHTTKGDEKWDQINRFDYDSMKVTLVGETNNPDDLERQQKKWVFDLNDRTYDIMGSYLFFRDLDWKSFKVGDSVMISTLEDHKIWDFGIEFAGREMVHYEGKKYNAYKVIVLFPVTKTFTQEKAVLFWVIEKDGVKLPISIEANMRIGKVKCELTSFEGKYSLE